MTSASLASAGAVNTATVAGGPYTITASAASGTGLSNYTISYNTGNLTVNKRNITVTALGGTSVYGDSPSNPGLSATNLASFDSVSALTGLSNSFGITSASTVNTYTTNVAGTLSNGNYNVTTTNTGSWSVTPKILTVTANNQVKNYGDTFTFAGTEFTTSGLINGDSVSSASLASAGAINTASVAGAPYTITINNALGSGLSNYAIHYVNGQLTLSRTVLTVTANTAARTTRQSNPEFTASFDGFFPGDGVNDLGGLLTFRTPASFGSRPGSYSLTPSGLSSSNYDFRYVDGEILVTDDLLRQADMTDPFEILFHFPSTGSEEDLEEKIKYELREYPGTISTLSSGEVP